MSYLASSTGPYKYVSDRKGHGRSSFNLQQPARDRCESLAVRPVADEVDGRSREGGSVFESRGANGGSCFLRVPDVEARSSPGACILAVAHTTGLGRICMRMREGKTKAISGDPGSQ